MTDDPYRELRELRARLRQLEEMAGRPGPTLEEALGQHYAEQERKVADRSARNGRVIQEVLDED
jgi:hypothetical protein